MAKKTNKKAVAENGNIVKVLKDFKNETIRHFDVVAEDLKGDIKMLAEQAASNTEKLEEHDRRFNQIDHRFDKVDQRLDKVKNTLDIVKMDLESIKGDLKKKVDWEDFVVLEKRVSLRDKGKITLK